MKGSTLINDVTFASECKWHFVGYSCANIEVGRLADSPGHIMMHNFAEPVILIHNPKPDNN